MQLFPVSVPQQIICFHYEHYSLVGIEICKLQAHPRIAELSKNGDIILGGIFNLHSGSYELSHSYTRLPDEIHCRSFSLGSFRLAQTMIFAIEEINRSNTLLPNITLGYRIYDDCISSRIATKAVLALVNGEDKTVSDLKCPAHNKVTAIVGCDGSSQSIAVARLIGPFRIPMVSYYSTCSCLSNRREYPSFFRTIPSDYHQSELLVQLVKKFRWTWIGTIRSNNDYGRFGMQAFVKSVEKLGVCIAYAESFHRTDPREKVSQIVEVIKGATTKVIVAFISVTEMRILLKEIVHKNVTDLQWVGSEAWVTAQVLPPEESATFLVGTIGPTIRRRKEFWETAFDCILKIKNFTDQEKYPKQCSGEENLLEATDKYLDRALRGNSYNVYKATYALAHAFHKMFSCENTKRSSISMHFTEHTNLQSVHFTTKAGDHVYFDENGDAVAIYDLVNWQTNVNGTVEIKIIGYYNGTSTNDEKLVFNEESITWTTEQKTVPRAICSESCLPGTIKVSKRGQPICCFDCVQCADGEISNTTDAIMCLTCPPRYWSNQGKDQCEKKKVEFLSYGEILGTVLATLAITGVCLTLAIAALFFKHRSSPIIKANNSELSLLLLLSLTLCFLCSLTFLGEPSAWSCMLRRTAFGVAFVLCISCVLGKTIVVLVAFKASRPNNKMLKWFSAKQQRLTIFALTFVQCFTCTLWLTISPPFPVENNMYYREIIIVECDMGSLTAFYCVSGYIALLSCLCFVLAFIARKLPDNFNEAKFITFSMLIFCVVWIAFIPAYVSSPGKYTVAVEVFAILASSFALLVCIFGPKCYIILIKPEQNTKKHLMGKETSNKRAI
uniref:Extracellular calcium-sensing receptor-like n=1 Tax=Callorhinchus milii TaxID=7868 RepID=A0A4W3HGR8_CALMI